MAKTINVTKTVTIATKTMFYLVELAEETNVPFSEALNDLCRDGIEARKARKAQEAQEAGGSEDGGE